MADSIETFEIKAIAFYRMTGKLAPGKDVPAARGGPDDYAVRQILWDWWNRMYGEVIGHAIKAAEEVLQTEQHESR